MDFENLLLERQDQIAIITVNRPKVMNALNEQTVAELGDCISTLAIDGGIRAIVITGAGEKAFIAGADISELARLSPKEAWDCALRGQAVFDRIESLGVPTIAAINGYALGGGCELALACSIRIASQTACLGQPEVKLGIIPGYGGSQRLPRLIGKGRALEMVLAGESVPADKALEWGLVNRVVPVEKLHSEALELARRIVANSPTAVRFALEAVNRGCSTSLAEGLLLEASLFGLAFATEDMLEGTKAFLEKRGAKFSGR
jgi:enoyl-CoA hydratase